MSKLPINSSLCLPVPFWSSVFHTQRYPPYTISSVDTHFICLLLVVFMSDLVTSEALNSWAFLFFSGYIILNLSFLWLQYPQLFISLAILSSIFFKFCMLQYSQSIILLWLQCIQRFFLSGYNILNFLFSLATISSTFYSLWLQYPQKFLSSNNLIIFFSGYSIINIFIWLQYHQHLLSGYSIMNIFYLGKISKAIFFSGSTFSRPQAAPSFHYSLSAIGADNEEQGTNNCSDRDLICLPRHLRDSLITASLFCFLESTAVYVLRISLPVNVVG